MARYLNLMIETYSMLFSKVPQPSKLEPPPKLEPP